jgi:Pirin-related protein
MIRQISGVIQGRYTKDGAGVKLYRVFGSMNTVELTDPFLLLDYFGSKNIEDYIMGFPWHPHRGIETVTYLLEGKVEHQDSEGNKGVIYPGDTQWMTAGSGIFHQEMPKPLSPDDKGILQSNILNNTSNRGLQLWINLPSHKKMTVPIYRDVKRNHVPNVKFDYGEVKVIAGEFDGVEGPVKAGKDVDPTYLDVIIYPGGEFSYKVKSVYNIMAYVLEGKARFSPRSPQIGEGNLVLYEEGDEIRIRSESGARFILLSGKPLREPIVWYGPIVMNTEEQILEALSDLRKGTFVRHKTPIFE